MTRLYLLIFVFLLSSFSSFAQQSKEEKLHHPCIQVKAGIKPTEIALRWAVDEPLAWQKANKIGFELKRYTLMRDGKLLSVPEEKVLGIFIPAPEKEWMNLAKKNDNAAIVAQSLFGENFEVEMGQNQDKLQGIINKSQEVEQRFAYALMSADLDFEIAKMAGWGFTDKEVKLNERYLYTVTLNPKSAGSSSSLLIEKGTAVANITPNYELPKPLDFIGIFRNENVILSWEYLQLRDIYSSYFIEKSENGKDFSLLNNLPVMNMNDTDTKQTQGMIYVDSLAQNGKLAHYRIRGKTIFGDFGPYSDIVSGSGKADLQISPIIDKFNILENEDISIHWEFPKESEKDITSFELLHSETDNTNSYKVIKNNIGVTERQIVSKSIAPSNYFKIQAITKNGDKRESFAIFTQPNDTTPPETPLQFKGKIDSTGVVHLEWKANTEKDLEGYHIFRGIQKGEEMVRITPQAITENSYKDNVVLENLNSKVYYYITATDNRKNQSAPSEILELEKPDKVRPQAPVFTEYKLESDGGITLHWYKSYSDDVAVHQLFRQAKEGNDKSWKKIYETKDIKPQYSFTDKDVEADILYNYYLLAIDKSELISDKSLELSLRSVRLEPISALSGLSSSINRDKKQIELIWKTTQKNISEILVYRQKGTEKPTLWGTLSGTQNFIEDSNIQVGNTYTYLIKPMLQNNQVAKTEKITVDY